VKQNLLDAGIRPEKITQIDDAVDLDIFHSNGHEENVLMRDFSLLRLRSGLDGEQGRTTVGKVLIGIVGRIQPAKRQLAFLQAAEQIIRGSTRDVTFIVIGDCICHSYFEQLKQFVNENGLSEHVIFTGNRDDMPEVLRSLDILVSLTGGSVMFEAMACGKAVVSAGFSSKEDSVHIQDGRTGVLVSSTRNSELVEALISLIESPELRRQIGREARKWAEKNFCHITMANKTQQLYRRLLQEK
jgi:glycosyltransferase involved in cell wall biosynthesis